MGGNSEGGDAAHRHASYGRKSSWLPWGAVAPEATQERWGRNDFGGDGGKFPLPRGAPERKWWRRGGRRGARPLEIHERLVAAFFLLNGREWEGGRDKGDTRFCCFCVCPWLGERGITKGAHIPGGTVKGITPPEFSISAIQDPQFEGASPSSSTILSRERQPGVFELAYLQGYHCPRADRFRPRRPPRNSVAGEENVCADNYPTSVFLSS